MMYSLTSRPRVTVTSRPRVTVTSRPRVTVLSRPRVTVTSRPRVTVTSRPRVTVTSRPRVTVTSRPRVTVTSRPRVTVTSKPRVTVSRAHPQGVNGKPREYTDVNTFPVKCFDPRRFSLVSLLGQGQYALVKKAEDLESGEYRAIKMFHQLSNDRFKKEVKILQNLQGGPNIIELFGLTKGPLTNNQPSFVLEYVNSPNVSEFLITLGDKDVRFYTFELLKGIDYIHECGIMHRDLKPQNMLIDHGRKILKICDFGLSEFYRPTQAYSNRIASKHYKAPEIWLKYPYYDYSVDMWSFGCIFAAVIFNKISFFNQPLETDQLEKIVNVLGLPKFLAYLTSYGIHYTLDQEGCAVVGQFYPQSHCRWTVKDKHHEKDFNIYVYDDNRVKANDLAINLLQSILRYDHQDRLTAAEAMDHDYFHDLNKKTNQPVPGSSRRGQNGSQPFKANPKSPLRRSPRFSQVNPEN